MELFCIGLNHESVSVAFREKLFIPESELGEICSLVVALEPVSEVVVLSTCNRLEIYVSSEEAGLPDVEVFFNNFVVSRGSDILPLYQYSGMSAVRHLCRVASGLDSMVIGETEIMGQVKKSYSFAHGLGYTGKRLNRLFQSVFKVAKFVRTNSLITRGATSVGAVGVDLAEKIFGDLSRCMVMVFGAGEMGKTVTKTLASRGVKGVIVSNRSYDKAVDLARDMDGRAIRLREGVDNLKLADIVITSTSAPHRILGVNDVARAVRKRRGRPLFMIDIAVPRDVDQDVANLSGVYLYDLDALQEIAATAKNRREKQVIHCETLIDEQMNFGGLDDFSKRGTALDW